VPSAAWGCCSPPGSPLALIRSSIFYLFQNNFLWNLSPIGVAQNRYPDGAFSGPDFQLPDFPLLVHTLQIMREKALELLQKGIIMHENIINNNKKT
jgi:hypothetical protein